MLSKIIKGRTGEVRITPGFWWAQHKDSGKPTIVQVTDRGGNLGVMFIGNLNWLDLDEAAELIEFMAPIEPY